MRKQHGLSVLAFLVILAVIVVGVFAGGSFYQGKAAEDAQREQTETAARAAAAAAEEVHKAKELEMATRQAAIDLCHAAVIKRAKYESKAKVTKTEIRREAEKTNMGETEMYVVTGKIDLMNAYGASLPNNYTCRVDLAGKAFVRDPAVAGEDEGDDAEKAELARAFKTLGINPNDYR